MKVERIKMSLWDIQPNPNNPRIITDIQLAKLIKSLREMPEMLHIRPLIVNQDNVVLGGNMRLKALEKLNIEYDIPVIRVEGLTPEQETEFVIKNNLSYGEWNWSSVVSDFDQSTLTNWGLTVPAVYFDDDEEPTDLQYGDLSNSIKQITLTYTTQEYTDMIDMLSGISRREDYTSFTDTVEYLINTEYENN
tara:strand:- start:293 stop:868 length:576 start_codon:yes stop_codon:yes gene_type:complete